jgi:hypothetical protein
MDEARDQMIYEAANGAYSQVHMAKTCTHIGGECRKDKHGTW